MPPSLIDLPPETLLAIAGYLGSAIDYIHLSRSHSSIGHKLQDRNVLVSTIQVSIPHPRFWQHLTWTPPACR